MSHDFMIPNTDNYHVASKVSAWINRKISAGVYAGWMPVGDVQDGNLTPETERLEHMTHQFGLNKKDKEVVIGIKASVSLVLSELVRDNLRYCLGSTGRTALQSFNCQQYEVKTFAAGIITLNGGAAIQSILGVYALDGTPYSEGATADYTATLGTGVITRQIGGGIGATEKVVVYYQKAISTASKYLMFDDPSPSGKLAVISDGGHVGPKHYIYFPDVDLSLDGDIPLVVKTDWQTASLRASVNEDASEGYGFWYNYD